MTQENTNTHRNWRVDADFVLGTYEKVPLTRRYFLKREKAFACPVDLMAGEMSHITLKEIGDGRLYCLSFSKP